MHKIGNNLDETLLAWADITLRILLENLTKFNFSDDVGHLKKSLRFKIFKEANGDRGKVEFFFNTYGRFVDMGVGKEYYKGNSGDVGFIHKQRRAKEWLYISWFFQVHRFKAILMEKYETLVVNHILNDLETIFTTNAWQDGVIYTEYSVTKYEQEGEGTAHKFTGNTSTQNIKI